MLYLLADILQNWDKLTVRQDGDAIRRLIGTIGVSSPLSSLRRAFVSVRDAEEESVRLLPSERGAGRTVWGDGV